MIRCRYVDLAAGQIHYRHRPGTGPAVVFLHQTASSSRMWLEVMRRLPGDHALYAFDTPGFGGSFDPPGMPSMPQYGTWIAEALATLGVERCHLVGHHTGCCIALEIALAAPERVLSLVMIGAVPLTAAEREEFRQHFSTPMSPTANGTYLKQTWDYLAGLGADSDVALHHRELVDTVRAHHGRYQAYSAVWDQDFTTPFKALAMPLLLLCAPGDVLMPYFERACALRPDASRAVLTGSNFEPDQDPEGVVAALDRFLSASELK